ncbi:hypothetical protein LXL04_039076 [Taraxacum kok-saghyz]
MAAWLVSINTLKIQPFKLPPLGPYDVRARMKAVGICGSDVHYLKTLRCADFVVKEPMDLVPGDRVALEPGISCWRCTQCKEGRYNLCPDMKFFATPPVHGSLANQGPLNLPAGPDFEKSKKYIDKVSVSCRLKYTAAQKITTTVNCISLIQIHRQLQLPSDAGTKFIAPSDFIKQPQTRFLEFSKSGIRLGIQGHILYIRHILYLLWKLHASQEAKARDGNEGIFRSENALNLEKTE